MLSRKKLFDFLIHRSSYSSSSLQFSNAINIIFICKKEFDERILAFPSFLSQTLLTKHIIFSRVAYSQMSFWMHICTDLRLSYYKSIVSLLFPLIITIFAICFHLIVYLFKLKKRINDKSNQCTLENLESNSYLYSLIFISLCVATFYLQLLLKLS